jgi:hypothetical protein
MSQPVPQGLSTESLDLRRQGGDSTPPDVPMSPVEIISEGEQPLVYLVRGSWVPQRTQFLTPDHLGQQVGMIVHNAGDNVQPHVHLPVVRKVQGTSECIVVRKGFCDIDIYNDRKQFLTSRELRTGDIALLIAGGHGFRMHENTILLEVKQGPYMGQLDKERF